MTTYRGRRPRRVPTWLILLFDAAALAAVLFMAGAFGDVGARLAGR